MHTVGFAEKQERLLLCPCPMPTESGREQYRGITMLIESGRAKGFTITDYPDLILEGHAALSGPQEQSREEVWRT